MSRKTEKSIKIAIVVLSIILIGFLGFILVDNFLLENNSGNQNKNPISTNKPVSSEEPKPTSDENIHEPEEDEIEIPIDLAEKIYNTFYDWEDCGERFSKYYKYSKVTADELTNEDKTYIISLNIAKRMEDHIFTQEEIMETKNRLLGSDTTFEIINSKECKYFFKLEDGTYDLNRYCSGGMCTYQEITDFIKTVQKGNKIYIDQQVIFEKSENHTNDEGMTSYYYQNPERTVLLETKDYKDSDEYIDKYNEIDWKKYEDQVSIYRFTYEDNGDNTYKFIQMEKIK